MPRADDPQHSLDSPDPFPVTDRLDSPLADPTLLVLRPPALRGDHYPHTLARLHDPPILERQAGGDGRAELVRVRAGRAAPGCACVGS